MQGYLKYFFHNPKSTLPIPDIENNLGKGNKTEYHLIGNGFAAENWVKPCQQHIIKKADIGDLIFWITKNLHRGSQEFDDQFIVGYLSVERIIPRLSISNEWISVYGKANLFSFEDSIKVKDIYRRNLNRGDLSKLNKLSKNETLSFLDHFSDKESIYDYCLEEVSSLFDEQTCVENCSFKQYCEVIV